MHSQVKDQRGGEGIHGSLKGVTAIALSIPMDEASVSVSEDWDVAVPTELLPEWQGQAFNEVAGQGQIGDTVRNVSSRPVTSYSESVGVPCQAVVTALKRSSVVFLATAPMSLVGTTLKSCVHPRCQSSASMAEVTFSS